MFKSRASTPRTMPTWDGHADTAIQHLNGVEKWLTRGQIQTWRDGGATEGEIAIQGPKVAAQHRAIFDGWRAEVRARLGLRKR